MVIVVMGVSGSGKTVVGRGLAGSLGCAFADADDFHPPANVEKMRGKQPLTDEDRKPWLDALSGQVQSWVQAGEPGVLACSALTERSRRALGIDGVKIRLVYLKGSYELIHSRIAARQGHFMPPDLLKSQFATLEEPREAVVIDVEKSVENIIREVLATLTKNGRGSL